MIARRTLAAALALSAAAAPAQEADWRDYAGDKGARRYAPLDQITAANAKNLRIAWQRPALPDDLAAQDATLPATGYFKSTPLKVGDRLYAQNAVGFVEAFDPATGATLWTQERFTGDALKGEGMRGIAWVEVDGRGRLLAVRDHWLYALDAETGKIVRAFGRDGRVDLVPGMGPRADGWRWQGAPQVCNGTVVLGASMTDAPANKEEPSGAVQAFDVATGAARWTFSPVPRAGDSAIKSWEGDSWTYSGEGNVWAPMSSDEALDLVYLPTSSPTNDMYGGHRLGNNDYTDSVVALKCGTGKVAWHYQVVHHDLWDYDMNAAPMLVDMTVAGKPVKAVVQLTKRSQPFVFDRRTGKPVWPIEERAVPPSTTPGERASPTQPFPTLPKPYEAQGSTDDNLIDFTPALHAEAKAMFEGYVRGPIFTPPAVASATVKGSFQAPTGGSGWPGGAFDPESGRLFVPSLTRPLWVSILPGDPATTNLRYTRGRRTLLEGPQGLPPTKPPYGRITAIDLTSGQHAWMVANADGPRDHAALKGLDVPRLGVPSHDMPLATKSLLFVALADPVTIQGRTSRGKIPLESYFDDTIRAYDKANGRIVWQMRLPAGATGSLMTYLHKGRQYVVVPIGGQRTPAGFVALALP